MCAWIHKHLMSLLPQLLSAVSVVLSDPLGSSCPPLSRTLGSELSHSAMASATGPTLGPSGGRTESG